MIYSIFLAKVIGPVLALMCFPLLLRKKQYLKIVDDLIKSPALMYVISFINLFLGTLLLVTHNVWVGQWPVVITMMGWAIILKGLLYLLFPETTIMIVKKYNKNMGLYMFSVLLCFVLGLYLTYMGYWGS